MLRNGGKQKRILMAQKRKWAKKKKKGRVRGICLGFRECQSILRRRWEKSSEILLKVRRIVKFSEELFWTCFLSEGFFWKVVVILWFFWESDELLWDSSELFWEWVAKVPNAILTIFMGHKKKFAASHPKNRIALANPIGRLTGQKRFCAPQKPFTTMGLPAVAWKIECLAFWTQRVIVSISYG